MSCRTLRAAAQSRWSTVLLLTAMTSLLATLGSGAERMVLGEYFTNTY